MNKLFRIIDANVNRASEGLRVLEDYARFYCNDKIISEKIKIVRHGIRKSIMNYLPQCLNKRDSLNDVGLSISQEHGIDNKASLFELVTANFKRTQEALRTIEENLKVLGEYEASKLYEKYRYDSYLLEKEYFHIYCRLAKRKKLQACLYCMTAEEFSCGRSNIEVVKSMINSRVGIIQYREKDKKLIQKYNECTKIRELTLEGGVTFIINDDIDIAMMVKADGVHLGQDDLPVEKVRELVGEEIIIGVSTHSPKQALNAVESGADYIGVGPIFKTFTKKNVCEPVGLEYLDYVVKNIDIPFVAIGGIKEHNLHEVISRGAKCVAMVTEIVGAENIEQKIFSIKQKMRGENKLL
ncbi:MAG: thiamine phosphate synthase [Actinobacteria bacterium]|nr:thiamine phosphate synthase [Actinomycetota bacterium]